MAITKKLRGLLNLNTAVFLTLGLIVAFAATILGLVRDNLHFVRIYTWAGVYVHAWPYADEDFGWLYYQPEETGENHLDLTLVHGLLAAGILSTVTSFLLLVTWTLRLGLRFWMSKRDAENVDFDADSDGAAKKKGDEKASPLP